MAKLFLSYSRKDESKARRFSQWLERDGYTVWRDDDDIGGGASFSSEIEKALNDADAVLVLWSAQSIQSAWVRDEAAYGRDAGKLIPFSLDGTEPPLGFRQFQLLSLAEWKRQRDPPTAERIRHAIGRLAEVPKPAPAPPPAEGPSRSRIPGRTLGIGAPIAVAAVALLAFFVWQHSANDRQITLSVVPSPQSSDRAMAADYANVAAADLATFLPRRFDRATVIGPADTGSAKSGYRMLISTSPRGAGVNASLTLTDEDGHTTLWSKNWSVADASALKEAVSATASKAALCLTDARGGKERLSQPALGLYLSGCVGLGDSQLSELDFQTIFGRVTKLAPDFAPGWGYLALSDANYATEHSFGSPAYQAAVQDARRAIAVARRLNPTSALTYHAEYHLIYRDHSRALPVIQKAAQADPDDGLIQMHLSDELMAFGLISESILAAQRAVELEPNSSYTRAQYIAALVYSGQFEKAKADIADARKKWPTDPQIDLAEYSLDFRYGDPTAALKLLPRVIQSSDADMDPARKVIAARLDPTPAKIDDAIAALNGPGSDQQGARNAVLMALANFGRVDQAFQLMEDPGFQQFIRTDVLFRPDFAAIRADPRFMQIAARLGLVRYWRTSGNWPDFCSNEKLRYDCKTEAAKYPN